MSSMTAGERPESTDTGSWEARCLYQTWKQMKMEGILEGGASETRSWRIGATSPIWEADPGASPDG
jgi:hypothetical protein